MSKKQTDEPKEVFVTIKKVPYKTYLSLRKQLMREGLDIQGYQMGYHSNTKLINDENKLNH